jgi:hypothetical protein
MCAGVLVPYCLLKFSREETHLVDFVDNGRIYANTVEFFSNCDRECDGMGDKFEMASSYHQSEGASVVLDGRRFEIVEPFCVREGRAEYSHVFCLYALSDQSLDRVENGKVFDDKLWHEFGDYVVLIHDVKSFLRRIDSKLSERGFRGESGLVQYFCQDSYEGRVGAFKKRNKYSHQEEFRVAIDRPGVKGPIDDLYLGSLHDIAYGPVHRSKSENKRVGNRVLL